MVGPRFRVLSTENTCKTSRCLFNRPLFDLSDDTHWLMGINGAERVRKFGFYDFDPFKVRFVLFD